MPNIDDLINTVINDGTDANDAIEDLISAVSEIKIGARVIVADSKCEYWGVIGDVIEIVEEYDEFSDADMLMAKVKVLRPMVQRSISMVGYPINSTDETTASDIGAEIVVPVDHLRCMTDPNGVVIKNIRAGGVNETEGRGTCYIDKERGRFVLIDVRTGNKWANEFFKSEDEAKEFAKKNTITIIDKK